MPRMRLDRLDAKEIFLTRRLDAKDETRETRAKEIFLKRRLDAKDETQGAKCKGDLLDKEDKMPRRSVGEISRW